MKTKAYIALLLGAVAISALSAAQAEEDASAERPGAQYAPDIVSRPIEAVLVDLAKRTGVSFVYDSLLLKSKRISPIENAEPLDSVLANHLRKEELQLHKINDQTYAITAMAPVTTAPPLTTPAVAAAALPDVILVTATAASMTGSGSRYLYEIDRDNLELLNAASTADVIFDLPQSLESFSSSTTIFLGAASGLTLTDYRGYGPERNLVLVNGRRRTITSGGNATVAGVNLATIAQPFLEKVEIVDHAQGARMGPEAISGAVNFVTVKGKTGLETGVRYGVSERGDAQELSVHALGGASLFGGAGNLTAGVNYAREDGLLARQREATAFAYAFAENGRVSDNEGAEFLPGYGGSLVTPLGELGGVVTESGDLIPAFRIIGRNSFTGDGGIEPFEGRLDQLFNYLKDQHSILPTDRLVGYVDFSVEMSADTSVFAEAHFGVANTEVQLASIPTTSFMGADPVRGNGLPIDIDNPTVPAELRDYFLTEFGPDVRTLLVNRRYDELGPRRTDVSRRFYEFVFGLRHDLGANTQFNGHVRYGRNITDTTQLNLINQRRFLDVLDPVRCTAAPGCTPVNVFLENGVSQAAADYVRSAPLSRVFSDREIEIDGRLDTKFSTPLLNDIDAIFGASLRRATIGDEGFPQEAFDTIGAFFDLKTDGRITTAEFYTNYSGPLIDDASPIGGVDYSLAYRVSLSEQYNTAHNFDAGLDWRPIEGVKFFGAYHKGERPPIVKDLYFIGVKPLYRFFFDPCAETNMDPVVAANCASDSPLGVSPGFAQTQLLADQVLHGRPDSTPEKNRSITYGLALEPAKFISSFPGLLSVRASWNDIETEHAIIDSGDALANCFGSPGFSDRSCGINDLTGEPLIRRDPVTEQITTIHSLISNGGFISWRGLDIEAQYAYEFDGAAPIDRLWFSGLHTYIDEFLNDEFGAGIDDRTGNADYPRHRSLMTAGVARGPISLSAFANRRGRVSTTALNVRQANIPSITIFDISMQAKLRENLNATVTMHNILDRAAPLALTAETGATFPQHYDIVGRSFSINLRAAF